MPALFPNVPRQSVTEAQVAAKLTQAVDGLLQRALEQQRGDPGILELSDAVVEAEEDGALKLALPLVRVRVLETMGYPRVNPALFGTRYLSKVANPEDILLFQRAKDGSGGGGGGKGGDGDSEFQESADEAMIWELLRERLQSSSSGLRCLTPTGLTNAVSTFVEKSESSVRRSRACFFFFLFFFILYI